MQDHAKVAIYSCLVNALLMAVKYVLGDVAGSLALRADAIHSLADIISSFAIFLGIFIADRKTRTFPEGLYKVENLVALVSSSFIFFAAYEIAHEAIKGESIGQIKNVEYVIIGIVFIVTVAFLFSRYELRVGLKVGSPSLVADAKHITTDLLSTLVILIAVLGSYWGYELDRYAAIIVAALVAKMGFHIMVDSLKVLLDATLDYATLDDIRKVFMSHPDVKQVVSLGGRNSGRYKFVEALLRMDTRLLRDAHEIIIHLEEEILDRHPNIDKLLIHYEPELKDTLSIATAIDVPANEYPDENARLSDHFGEAPYFAILLKDNRNGSVSIQDYLKNPFIDLERHRGVKAAELLAERGVDEVITLLDLQGKGAGYALEALQIDAFMTTANTLKELMSKIQYHVHPFGASAAGL
ncbi:MAG: cation diffusion facilitator family transporter [Deltaproteobacteria bacterium]|nr:cation diffusion facilitator family transporter [Deltaproteobacteria bacterium]